MIPDSNNAAPIVEIVQLAMAGDRDAFGLLVEQYAGLVTGVAYSVLGDFDRSEDAGQEAFLEAWKKRDTLQDPSQFGSWICSIARHRALDLVRRRSRTETGRGSLAHTEVVSDEPSVEETVLREEEKTLVWRILDGLPPNYRDVMVLYYRGNESVAAVADSLGENEPTIRQRLHRGRQLLRDEVDAIVGKALRGTAPTAVFTAAVLGSLPGNAYAAAAGSVDVGKAAVSGSVLSTAAAGGVFGALGGLACAGLGAWLTYRTSPYAGQRRLVVGFVVFAFALTALFACLLGWLISVQTSADPMPDKDYGRRLMTLIFGYQGMFMVSAGIFAWMYSRAKSQAVAAGEGVSPAFEKFALKLATSRRQYTSPSGFGGRPWIDVQFAERTSDLRLVGVVPARGWIAVGDRAYGWLFAMGETAIAPVAVGGKSLGVFAIGGICLGVVSIGGLAMGGITIGGLAIGGLALGGMALGYHAVGGGAFGWSSAAGGGAWSKGHAEGGYVVSETDATAMVQEAGETSWLQWTQYDAWPPIVIETAIVIGVAFVCGVIVLQVITIKLAVPASSTERTSNDCSSNEISRAKRRSTIRGVLGGLTGGTAWISLLGFQSEHWLPGVVPAMLYGVAATYLWRMYIHATTADPIDAPTAPRVSLLKGLVALNIATTLGLIYLSAIGFQQPQAYMWLPTVWIISQLIYATNALLIWILLTGRDHSTSQTDKSSIAIELPRITKR